MYIIFEILLIMSYLLNDYLGFAMSIIIFSLLIYKNKKNIYKNFADILVLSLPLYSLSIVGDKINHAFSWILIMLLILSIYNFFLIIKERKTISKKSFALLLLGIVLLIISNVRTFPVYGLIEVGQVLMMIIPIITTCMCKDIITKKINKKDFNNVIKRIEDVIIATAICTIIQCIAYYVLNMSIGKISIYPNRIIFDLFFKAYSVLSLFIGIGIIIAVIRIIKSLQERKIEYTEICKLIVFIIAIVINSSRTGIIAAIITTLIILNSKIVKLESRKKIEITLVFIAIALISIELISLTRKDMSNIFSDNERRETYMYGINLIAKNPINIFIGNGLSTKNYDHIMPHNFILETITTSGIIVTILVSLYLTKLLLYLKNTNYRFIIYCILIGSMFITCFYGNPFTTVYIILAILDEHMKEVKE